MPKKGEILWEVGKQLSKENWTRGEFVRSEIYQIPDTCSLQIYFYPAGVSVDDVPTFKFVRTNTTLVSRKIKGDIQLYHRDTLAASFILDHVFERNESEFHHFFRDYLTLHRLKIFHSLPELSYLWRYIVLDPDPNEAEPQPAPKPITKKEPEPAPELIPTKEPEPAPKLIPTKELEPVPELIPTKEPEPAPELIPTKEPEPAPKLIPTKELEPAPELIPTKEPEPAPKLIPTKELEPAPELIPTKEPEPAPELIPTKEPEPAPELIPNKE